MYSTTFSSVSFFFVFDVRWDYGRKPAIVPYTLEIHWRYTGDEKKLSRRLGINDPGDTENGYHCLHDAFSKHEKPVIDMVSSTGTNPSGVFDPSHSVPCA